MMEDSASQGAEEEDVLVIDIQVEFYIANREEPLHAFTTFRIHKKHLKDEGEEVMDLMNILLMHILADWHDKNDDTLCLSDRRFNKYVIRKEDIQGVSLLAPDEETLLALLNS